MDTPGTKEGLGEALFATRLFTDPIARNAMLKEILSAAANTRRRSRNSGWVSRSDQTRPPGRHDACRWHPDGRHEMRNRMGSFGNADPHAVDSLIRTTRGQPTASITHSGQKCRSGRAVRIVVPLVGP